MSRHIAMLSLHSCPTAKLGERDTGGMNVYVQSICQELAQQGVKVDIFARLHDETDPLIIDISPNARLIHIEAGPPETPKQDLYPYLSTFIENLQIYCQQAGNEYDLLHSHYWLSALVGEQVTRNWGIPHVTTFHTLAKVKAMAQAESQEPLLRSDAERYISDTSDALIVSHNHEHEALVQLYGATSDKIYVVPCGVNTDLFHPMSQKQSQQALGLTGRPVVLFVGRADPVKGADLLLRAVATMEEDQEADILMVGGNPEKDPEARRLQQLSESLGLSGKVRFEGIIPQEKLPLYYNAAEMLVMPSYSESFGLVALEAMACGTPVIAARVGGLPSLVKDGDSGYLVPWHCPEPYATRI
ncbi:glycosyltransferase family 1 protein, partial [SAR202 cluster bacterium AD-802-E10_MRT_200m]|nr:glycosyltransferase family 1 protein [SAR202 cluster bacterium AD-802-E10_MRT_200m]